MAFPLNSLSDVSCVKILDLDVNHVCIVLRHTRNRAGIPRLNLSRLKKVTPMRGLRKRRRGSRGLEVGEEVETRNS